MSTNKSLTREHWQYLADAAYVWTMMESLREQGLLEGPPIDVGPCDALLERAGQLGIAPANVDSLGDIVRAAMRGTLPRLGPERVDATWTLAEPDERKLEGT